MSRSPHRIRRPLAWLLAAIGLAILGALPCAAVAAAEEAHFNPPKQSYLALGDSLAFGYQDAKYQQEKASGTYDPATFNTGYVDDFAAMLRAIRPRIATVNLACAGETSTTFINGNCSHHNAGTPDALHTNYPIAMPQLTAALDFLRQHRGKVSPITLDLGANDLRALLTACNADLACTQAQLPGVLAQVRANVDTILGALRRASPDSEIILLTVNNPYVVVQGLGAASAQAVQALNAVLAEVAAAHGVRVADGYTPLSTPAQICALTPMCTARPDIHPNDAGYAVLAQAVWQASGYDRLGRDE